MSFRWRVGTYPPQLHTGHASATAPTTTRTCQASRTPHLSPRALVAPPPPRTACLQYTRFAGGGVTYGLNARPLQSINDRVLDYQLYGL